MLLQRPMAFLILVFFLTQPAGGAAKKVQSLAHLQKITVGPFDNYQAAINDDESILYFTRSQNLSSQIIRMDLTTGLSRNITGIDADAKAPAISPDGKTLAFTSYRNDAKGDVCLLREPRIECITGPGLAEHSPFWVDAETLAYLESNDAGTLSKLYFHSIRTHKAELILEGGIYSPSLAKDGHTLVYKGRGNALVLFDIKTRKSIRTLDLQLPGATGPARFSHDSKNLYFAQYMIDSNRDLVLDGRDAAAIFRVSIDDGQSSEPEQLTSLQQNCSYPNPGAHALYLTCAFEGALDIYRSSLSGIVPSDWTENDLWEAHRAARSYSDRILILNQLFIRKGALGTLDYQQRILSDFILLDAWQAAQFYAELLRDKLPIYALHANFLATYARWNQLPKKENLGAFAEFLVQQKEALAKLPDSPLRLLVGAYYDFFAQDPETALSKAHQLRSSDSLTLYWLTQLYKLLDTKLAGGIYQRALVQGIADTELEGESRVYYLSRWLETLPSGQDPSVALRQLKEKLGSAPHLMELLEHEQQLYKLVHSRDKQENLLEMRGIVDRVELLKSDYFSLRLLFNRCMIVLYEAKKTRELASIMSLWLRYTKPETKEFPFVIEALRQNSLDMAYRFYQGPANEKKLALGSFMDSIRTSDDLEAHYQYALLNFAEGPWAELNSNYRSMQRDGLIKGESIVFVETLRSILQAADHLSKADLAEAAERIEAISDQHTGVGAKFLFLGYLYHRQVLLSAKNFAFDRDLADKAHRSYLFAIDAAWNNDRIKAGALQNLGLLHSQLRNDSLAAEFLQKRQELPFPNDAVKQAVLWIEAKAMFRSYRPLEALQLIEQALATAPQQSLVFLEKKAFYAWNAGEYQLAADSYARLLPALESKAPAGLYLSQAYTLMKLQKFAEAEQAALKAIERSEQAQKTKSGLDLEQNLKIRFVVLGLLAHSQLPITNLLTYQTERLKLFSKILPLAKILHFQEETLKSQRVKETLDLVLLQLKAGQKEGARNTLQEAIQLTSDYGIAYGYLAHTIFVSLKNIQLVILQEKLPLEPKFEKVLATISEGGEREFANEKNPVPVVRQKWSEVQLINLAFQGQQRSLGLDWFQHESEALLTAESAKILKEEKPKLYDQLQNYRQNMLTTLHKYQQRF